MLSAKDWHDRNAPSSFNLLGPFSQVLNSILDECSFCSLVVYFQGFISGFGKGLIGTVTKPAVGVLDLATGTVAAVRHTTQSSSAAPRPVRLRRCCAVPGGALPSFNDKAALGQQYLLQLNHGDTSEM